MTAVVIKMNFLYVGFLSPPLIAEISHREGLAAVPAPRRPA
jgi:hypothetical protein